MKTIVCCEGTGLWFTNMGTAFFNLGVIHALKTAFPDTQITFIGDQPGCYWKNGRNLRGRSVLIDDLACDYFVISGPVFGRDFESVWRDSLMRLKAKGTKIVFLSAGALEYSQEEFHQCRSVLKACKPHLIMTRDSEIYKMYSEFAEYSFDGICLSFFCNDYMTRLVKIDSEDIILGFDRGLDYDVLVKYGPDIVRLLEEGTWAPNGNRRPVRRSRSSSRITTYDKYRIVRPHHAPHPGLWRKLFKSYMLGYYPFRKPNCYISDNPEGYLHLYRHAKLTVSERVHACAPALAFGNYAWLINKTKRGRLFSRIGLPEITERPIRADKKVLDAEKKAIIDFLKDVL
jgi:hypothetical protein